MNDKASLNNIPKDILLIIIRFQTELNDYNPAMFIKFYKECYEEYMEKETGWIRIQTE